MSDLAPSPYEAAIQAEIRLALGRERDQRWFRNSRGKAWMGQVVSQNNGTIVLTRARLVEFGLTNGASDLIGIKRVIVTPEMVGQTVGLFGAIEVKRAKETVPDHQARFIDFVRAFGGVAGAATSADDARRIAGIL